MLLYAWYNFIIDINVEKHEFEWVKYRNENKLNENRKLARVFLNCGYYLRSDQVYKDLTPDDLSGIIEESKTPNMDYPLKYSSQHDGIRKIGEWICASLALSK